MRSLALVLLFMACSPDEGAGPRNHQRADDLTCEVGGPDQVLLTRALSFARATDDTSLGFDLDGYDTLTGQPEGCGIADYTAPDGSTGIDNAMAALLPILDTTEAAVLEDLMQASINDGSLILMLELVDLDDVLDDACVDLAVYQGVGSPMVGADGWLLANQTLGVATDAPVTTAVGGSVVDGVLEVGPVPTVALRIRVLDLDATFELHDVMLRLERDPEGVWRGMLGGGVRVDDLLYVATLANVDPIVADLMEPALALLSDLAPDETGDCTQLSVALEIAAVPAFIFE